MFSECSKSVSACSCKNPTRIKSVRYCKQNRSSDLRSSIPHTSETESKSTVTAELWDSIPAEIQELSFFTVFKNKITSLSLTDCLFKNVKHMSGNFPLFKKLCQKTG